MSNCAQSKLIIDCGSGFTRAKVFYTAADGIHSQEAGEYVGQGSWQQPALVSVLLEGDVAVRAWVSQLQVLIDACSSSAVIAGATGGLRQAMRDGHVTSVMLEEFRAILYELAPLVDFRYLSSEEEAEAELWGVQHIAEIALPASIPRPVGLISGGGMTCQVAYYPDGNGEPAFMSLVADLLGVFPRMKEIGLRRALAEFEARLAQRVMETGLTGQLTGTFIVIEMLGFFGDSRYPALEALGLGKRVLSKLDIIPVLTAHIEDWLNTTDHVNDYRDAHVGILPVELLGLLTLLDENSRIYIQREWEIAPGEMLKPDWSLGLYVTSNRTSPVSECAVL